MDAEVGKSNSPDVLWVSGTVQSQLERQQLLDQLAKKQEKQQQRIKLLRNDPDLPLVWMVRAHAHAHASLILPCKLGSCTSTSLHVADCH